MKYVLFLITIVITVYFSYGMGATNTRKNMYAELYDRNTETIRGVWHRDDGMSVLCLRMVKEDALRIYHGKDGKAPLKIKDSCLSSIYED